MDTSERLLALMKNALNGDKTQLSISEDDQRELYSLAEQHMVSALISRALESMGQKNEYTRMALAKASRKSMLHDYEKNRVFEALEKAHVWHAPLKGMVLKEYYPSRELREMSDCDVLIDLTKAEEVKTIMQELGFTVDSFGEDHHDVYYKAPISCFEMHRYLFKESHPMFEYYVDIKSKLVLDEGSICRYHFKLEDFYVYIIAHENVHCDVYNGTGVRSLADIYVFLKKYQETMDWAYVKRECQKIGIWEFEEKNRKLALNLFGPGEMTPEEKKWLRFFVEGGVYGSSANGVHYKVDAYGGGIKGRIKYVFKRLFPPLGWIKTNFPFVYKHKVLLVFVPFLRLGQALTTRRKAALKEIKAVTEREEEH